jgi:hypothetical protein
MDLHDEGVPDYRIIQLAIDTVDPIMISR